MTEGSRGARIRCREIMTSNVKTATRDMPLRDVAAMMRDGDMIDGLARQERFLAGRDVVRIFFGSEADLDGYLKLFAY